MSKTFSLNENDDIFIGEDGNLSISTGKESISFVCENVAQTRLSEMVFEQEEGQPYLEAVFTGSPNIERFRSELRKSLIGVEGVSKVLDLVFARKDKDTLEYQATIVADQTQVVVNGTATI